MGVAVEDVVVDMEVAVEDMVVAEEDTEDHNSHSNTYISYISFVNLSEFLINISKNYILHFFILIFYLIINL